MEKFIAVIAYSGTTLWIIGWASHRAVTGAKSRSRQSDWVLAAIFVYVFSYLVLFIGGAGIFIFGGEVATEFTKDFSANWPWLGTLQKLLDGKIVPMAPIYSVAAIHAALAIGPVNKLDARVLEWLHATNHLNDEQVLLRAALETKPFEPSDAELQMNREKLKNHDVHITDNLTISGNTVFVTEWRKVACLLRLLQDKWRGTEIKSTLTPAEVAELQDIQNADDRKMKHFFDIIRALKASTQNSDNENSISDNEGSTVTQGCSTLIT